MLHLITRKEIYVPTLRGWALLIAGTILCLTAAIREVHPFLAMNQPIGEGILILEGWISEDDLQQTLPILTSLNYEKILVTGSLLENDSIYKLAFPNDKTLAEATARQIIMLGISSHRVIPVIYTEVDRDNTYNAALAVKEWLNQNDTTPPTIDILSLGPHARRTHLLYTLALGNQYKIGIISQPKRSYDPSHWWKTSNGVRIVISESIKYIYAKFFFYPVEPH